MLYEKYIKLGFKRTDTHDDVEFKQTWYHGFILSKDLNENISIQVCHPELYKPKMYIKKPNTCTCHIVQLTSDMVFDMFAGETETFKSVSKKLYEKQAGCNTLRNENIERFGFSTPELEQVQLKGESFLKDKKSKYPVAVFASSRLEGVKLAIEHGLDPENKLECELITKPDQINSRLFSEVLIGDISKMDSILVGAMMTVSKTQIEN